MWLSVSLERSGEGLACSRSRFPLSRNALAGLRLKAIRRGVWFRVLKNKERKLMDLVIKIVDKVRSRILAEVLSRFVNSLLEAMESEVCRLMRTRGRDLAQRLSHIAQVWGNRSAVDWAADLCFVKFLAICHMNIPSTLKG